MYCVQPRTYKCNYYSRFIKSSCAQHIQNVCTVWSEPCFRSIQYTALHKVTGMVKTDESTTVIKPVVFKPPQIIFSHKRPADGRGAGTLLKQMHFFPRNAT